jgi:hypothetical protein
VLTYGLGAVLLFLPLAFTIEGLAVANTYAGTSDPTAQGHASEAMFGVALWGFVACTFVIGCAVVGGIIARQGRLNVFVAILVGVVLMVLVTLPLAWLFIRPVGGAWLA